MRSRHRVFVRARAIDRGYRHVQEAEAFRLDGKVLVLFGATAKHCSFFPGSGTAVDAHNGDLEGYSTSKGTIRFDPDKPLPATLVRKIVRYRIAENAARTRHVREVSKS